MIEKYYQHTIELETDEFCISFETNNEKLFNKILYDLKEHCK